jgi:hypothetical protein
MSSGAYDGSGREGAYRSILDNKFGNTAKVGDEVSIFGIETGRRVNGTVAHIFEPGVLPGWEIRNIVVEIPTHIDPLLEVRQAWTVWPPLTEAELAEQAKEAADERAEEENTDPLDRATERLRRSLGDAMDALTEIQRLRFGAGSKE